MMFSTKAGNLVVWEVGKGAYGVRPIDGKMNDLEIITFEDAAQRKLVSELLKEASKRK